MVFFLQHIIAHPDAKRKVLFKQVFLIFLPSRKNQCCVTVKTAKKAGCFLFKNSLAFVPQKQYPIFRKKLV